MIDIDVLRRARDLWAIGPEHPFFTNSLGKLDAQLSASLALARASGNVIEQNRPDYLQHRAMKHLEMRISDFLTRIHLIDWLWEQAIASGNDMGLFGFRALAIKDVHIDVIGVMDAAAPIAIQTTGSVNWGRAELLPGHRHLTSAGKHRESLPGEVRNLVDGSIRWLNDVIEARNILTHRDHHKVVFGRVAERRTFQVFDPTLSPLILDSRLLAVEGHQIVDLNRYLAYVWAEVNVYLDSLGVLAAEHLQTEITGGMTWATTATYLMTEIDDLIDNADVAA
jgi:hypothetical protein